MFTQQAGANGSTVRTPGSEKPTVHVHQYFPEPTQNKQREAAYAQHAMRAAFD